MKTTVTLPSRRRCYIPLEILNHIFGYTMINIIDEQMIRKVCALREIGSDFNQAIAESVRELNVGSLLSKYEEGERLVEYSSHLSKNIEKIVHIFPKLERLNLDGLSELSEEQLEYLLDCFEELNEISLVGCRLITQFKCRDISQFKSVTVTRENVSIRSNLYRQIALAVYDSKPTTRVKVPNGMYSILKSIIGTVVKLDLSPQDSIHDVKMLYEGFTGISGDTQRMIFAGKRLSDERLLVEYNFTASGLTLTVVFRLSSNSDKIKNFDRPNYNHVELTPESQLISNTLFEHDDFKVLELDILNRSTCDLFTKDILYEKKEDYDYNITSHLSNPFKKYLNNTVIPYLNKMGKFDRKIHQVQDIFVVHYSPDKDQDLVLHLDPSYVTLNICVHTSETFSGNEIEFVTQQEQEASEIVSQCGCGSEMNESQFTYQRITPKIGKALIHLGNHPHRTLKIIDGKRFNIICWLK